jgi:ABC-type lipoprotein export system ATPase subunit
MKERVHNLLKEEQENGITILCASHDKTTLRYSTSSYLLKNARIHPISSEK